jgi:DNA (cytosine-5)-methyltransferase 1
MTHGSLFSGIGGFDLAAEWMGWENKFHCEWNEFGQKVLKYYWPESELFTDITKSDFTKYANQIDVLTGGFPCQPYSTAGKRLGKEDDRHLWPEMLRVIREVKPRWVIGENVLGLVNWNGGLVFHEVQTDLEAQGYEVFPYVLPAVSVNAPHRRDRVWFVAYSNNSRNSTLRCRTDRKWKEKSTKREQSQYEFNRQSNTGIVANSNNKGGSTRFEQVQTEDGEISERNNNAKSCDTNQLNDVANTCGSRLQTNNSVRKSKGEINSTRNDGQNVQDSKSIRQEYALENGELERRRLGKSNQRNVWDSFPSVSPLCNGDDGLSSRLDSITFSKWRKESIKAGGNAIVPQVVYQIFKTIELYEHKRASDTTGPGSM